MSGGEESGPRKWTLEEWEALFGDFVNGGMPDRLCAYLASEDLERPPEEARELVMPPEGTRQNPGKTLAWWMACGAMARRAELRNKRALRWQAQIRHDAGKRVPPELYEWIVQNSLRDGTASRLTTPPEPSRSDMICVITLQELCGLSQARAIGHIVDMCAGRKNHRETKSVARTYLKYIKEHPIDALGWRLIARKAFRPFPPEARDYPDVN